MAFDQPVIQQLLQKLHECIGPLRNAVRLTHSEYMADANLEAATERRLQLAIQACIDLAQQIIFSRGLRQPESAADAFSILRETGYLDDNQANGMKNLVGLRNVLVHDYLALDVERVYAELHRDLALIEEFATVVAVLLEAD